MDKNLLVSKSSTQNISTGLSYEDAECMFSKSVKQLHPVSKNLVCILKTQKNKCKLCGAADTMIICPSSGYKICSECGTTSTDQIECFGEWKTSHDSADKLKGSSCCGKRYDFLMPQSSMSTFFEGGSYAQSGIKRIQGWNRISSAERTFSEVSGYIERIVINNGLTKSISDLAKFYYKTLTSKINEKVYETDGNYYILNEDQDEKTDDTDVCDNDVIPEEKERIINSRSKIRIGLMASCVYYACKENKVCRSGKEITDMFSIKNKDFANGKKRFSQMMMEKKMTTITSNHIQFQENDIFGHYVIKFRLHECYKKLGRFIIERAKKIGIINNRTPITVVGGTVYLISIICNLNISIEEINNITQISNASIKKVSDVLTIHYSKVLPKCLYDKFNPILIKQYKKTSSFVEEGVRRRGRPRKYIIK